MIFKLSFGGKQKKPDGKGGFLETEIPKGVALQLQGPHLPVSISHPANIIKANASNPNFAKSISCTALIDTGASSCVITPRIATELGLIKTGSRKVTGVHGGEDRPIYFGRINFPWNKALEAPLVCCELTGFDCIIGREVMRNWHIVYDGLTGEITICD